MGLCKLRYVMMRLVGVADLMWNFRRAGRMLENRAIQHNLWIS